MKIKLLRENSVMPFKAHETDAGYDLTVSTIKKRSLFKVHYGLGIAVDFDKGWYAEVPPRSSIHKRLLIMSNSLGIIDNPYKGEWQAVFYRIPFISKPYKVGDACCQAIFKTMEDEGMTFEPVDNVGTSDRGEGHHGSTDKKKIKWYHKLINK